VRYTARLASDPAAQWALEVSAVAGTGVQERQQPYPLG